MILLTVCWPRSGLLEHAVEVDFETDAGNSSFERIICSHSLNRRSSSKDCSGKKIGGDDW